MNILRGVSGNYAECATDNPVPRAPVRYRTLNLNNKEDVDLLMCQHSLRDIKIVNNTLQEVSVARIKLIRRDHSVEVLVVDREKKTVYVASIKHPFFGMFREQFETSEAADSWKQLALECLPGTKDEMVEIKEETVEL